MRNRRVFAFKVKVGMITDYREKRWQFWSGKSGEIEKFNLMLSIGLICLVERGLETEMY